MSVIVVLSSVWYCCCYFLLFVVPAKVAFGFTPPRPTAAVSTPSSSRTSFQKHGQQQQQQQQQQQIMPLTLLFVSQQEQQGEQQNKNKKKIFSNDNYNNNNDKKKKKIPNKITMAELRKEYVKEASKFQQEQFNRQNKKSKRSRKRVENPQQTYLYAAQRRQQQQQQKITGTAGAGAGATKMSKNNDNNDNDDPSVSSITTTTSQNLNTDPNHPVNIARDEFGLVNAANQHCEAVIIHDNNIGDDDSSMLQLRPQIMGQIRVAEETENGSGAFAYLIYKPAGWSILGSNNNGNNNNNNNNSKNSNNSNSQKQQPKESSKQQINMNTDIDNKSTKSKQKRIVIQEEDGSEDILEYNEDDILSLLTPEELAELREEEEEEEDGINDNDDDADADENDDLSLLPSSTIIPGWYDVEDLSMEEREEAGIEDSDFDPNDIPEFDEADILALLSEEEKKEYEQDKQNYKLFGSSGGGGKKKKGSAKKRKQQQQQQDPLLRYQQMKANGEILDPSVEENIKRIEQRLLKNKQERQQQKKDATTASFKPYSRPSIVAWLKDLKASEGTPIRGGNFWTAIAGATEVDDSGLVLLCPKAKTQNIFVEYAEYIAVVGNGQFLTPPKLLKGSSSSNNIINQQQVEMSIVARVRKGREGDTCQTVRFTIPESMSTCSDIVSQAQAQFDDGIRGDPASNPLDRRAPRRLIHCNAMSASSLLSDDDVQVECDSLPDDISILSDRLNNHKFTLGSFLGRSALRENRLTNAYREINGAADGYPGWTVDRYGDWLFVQHDEKEYKGPLPSIHDGKTAGVYYLPANPDRSSMGSTRDIRPMLLEGRAAPDMIPVVENGVTYLVSIDKDLSTGMFLDQRLHRAWLTRNCNENTHVLNCFAHCGAFSVAAASAGASTVSLDLNKKWLDRVQPQLEANGIPFDERHDCIYGDCFDWLEKLAKRGEKFDIVILDPPSSSVGGKKKKRWSVKNDMDELVALAAPLVKKGGLLWTTTNSAAVSPIKFARLCKKGLDQAAAEEGNINSNSVVKLERIQPMPVDFPSVGPQPVKNLVWRF